MFVGARKVYVFCETCASLSCSMRLSAKNQFALRALLLAPQQKRRRRSMPRRPCGAGSRRGRKRRFFHVLSFSQGGANDLGRGSVCLRGQISEAVTRNRLLLKIVTSGFKVFSIAFGPRILSSADRLLKSCKFRIYNKLYMKIQL